MLTKTITAGVILGFLLLTMVVLTDSLASSGEEAVHAYNQDNLYYEWELPESK